MVPILVALQMEAFAPHLRHRKLQTLYQSPTWTRNRLDKMNLFGGVQVRLVRLALGNQCARGNAMASAPLLVCFMDGEDADGSIGTAELHAPPTALTWAPVRPKPTARSFEAAVPGPSLSIHPHSHHALTAHGPFLQTSKP